MTYPIKRIAGVDDSDIEALRQVGIRTAERLVEVAKSPKGRRDLFDRTGID